MADINIAGSGDCTIDATEKLDVSIAGSGDVYYLGSPEISKSIAGSGTCVMKSCHESTKTPNPTKFRADLAPRLASVRLNSRRSVGKLCVLVAVTACCA